MKLLIGSLALFALVASVAAGGGLGPVPPTFGLRRGGGHGRKGAPEPVPVPVMWAPTYWPTAPPPAVSTGRKSVSVEAPPIMNAAIDLGDQYLPKQHFQSSNAPRLGHIKEVEIIQRVDQPYTRTIWQPQVHNIAQPVVDIRAPRLTQVLTPSLTEVVRTVPSSITTPFHVQQEAPMTYAQQQGQGASARFAGPAAAGFNTFVPDTYQKTT